MGVKIKDLIAAIDGKVLTQSVETESIVIEDGYVSDLLSDVMGNARDNQAWITIMKHMNSVAVASLAGIPCIVFAKGVQPEKEVIQKGEEEKVLLVTSELSSFEICGKLYCLLNDLKK
ncbi:MAG: hypothetical protein WCX83_02430 [Candidatus Cloacimonas sp.]|nr:hypothetical protein [Candidatus Cloacimonadota bacterium]